MVSDNYDLPLDLYQKETTDRTVTFLRKDLVIRNYELAVCIEFFKNACNIRLYQSHLPQSLVVPLFPFTRCYKTFQVNLMKNPQLYFL